MTIDVLLSNVHKMAPSDLRIRHDRRNSAGMFPVGFLLQDGMFSPYWAPAAPGERRLEHKMAALLLSRLIGVHRDLL